LPPVAACAARPSSLTSLGFRSWLGRPTGARRWQHGTDRSVRKTLGSRGGQCQATAVLQRRSRCERVQDGDLVNIFSMGCPVFC
jgi:hypothetical protein